MERMVLACSSEVTKECTDRKTVGHLALLTAMSIGIMTRT